MKTFMKLLAVLAISLISGYIGWISKPCPKPETIEFKNTPTFIDSLQNKGVLKSDDPNKLKKILTIYKLRS